MEEKEHQEKIPKDKTTVVNSKELLNYVWKEKDPRIKIKLSTLNFIAYYKMNVEWVSK